MLHYIFALFFALLSNPIFTGFAQPKTPPSKSSQRCSSILDSIPKETKDKKDAIEQDLDQLTVFIPTKEFYKKKLLDQAQANGHPISIPQALKEEEEDDDDEKEINELTKILQNTLPANNSGITVNPNYGIGIVPEKEKQQNKKKTQLNVDLQLALHLNINENLALLYSRHKDFCKDKEIISDKDTCCNTSSFTPKKFLCICGGACLGIGVACLLIKTAPVTIPIALAAAAARKDSKRNYAMCAPCDKNNSSAIQDQNLQIIWILSEEHQSKTTKENIIASVTQGNTIKIPTGATAIGVAGAAAGVAGLGLSVGLGSGAGTVVATAGGIVITGTVIPVIIGGAVVGYTVKLSIDAVRSLIQHVKDKRAEKKAKKELEKNNPGGNNNRNNNDKDPKDKKDKTPKNIPNNQTKKEKNNNFDNKKNNDNVNNQSNHNDAITDILKETTPGEKTTGRTKQYLKPGGGQKAMEDFEALEVLGIHDIPFGKAGVLPDGRHVNVRLKSTEGSPTLEIFDKIKNRRIKIRYTE